MLPYSLLDNYASPIYYGDVKLTTSIEFAAAPLRRVVLVPQDNFTPAAKLMPGKSALEGPLRLNTDSENRRDSRIDTLGQEESIGGSIPPRGTNLPETIFGNITLSKAASAVVDELNGSVPSRDTCPPNRGRIIGGSIPSSGAYYLLIAG